MVTPIAVVTVTYAPGDALETFLDTLRTATSAPLDIVVADHGGTASGLLAPRHSDVRVVDTGDVGYGRAANIGVYATTAEFVVVANPDIEWQPGSLDQLLAATRRWPRGAAFGPRIQTAQGETFPSARAVPSLSGGIGHALFGWLWPRNPWTATYRVERAAPAERTAGWLAGSCLLLRRDAFDDVGGFDPERLTYLEDLDLGERLARAGWQNVYVPSALVRGGGRQSSSSDDAHVTAEQHRSAWSYLSRRYSGLRWLPLRMLLRVGLAIRAVVAKRVSRVARGAAPQRRD